VKLTIFLQQISWSLSKNLITKIIITLSTTLTQYSTDKMNPNIMEEEEALLESQVRNSKPDNLDLYSEQAFEAYARLKLKSTELYFQYEDFT
jgi:hypothetical protein